ncbi:MAG: hypothetical protein M1838_001056 [Thelocarpon superellum]|nr:MAG: hypothetical protein M1838_001056 [Thelocarpon superellum]
MAGKDLTSSSSSSSSSTTTASSSSPVDRIPHTRNGERPDYLKSPPAPEKLPRDLQDLLDQQDTLFDEIYDGSAPDSTDSSVRYAAYATRIRTILLSAQRYVAYTSDVGESFRPVAHPYLIRTAYAVSWAYLAGDVTNEGYKAYLRNQRLLYPNLHPPADSSVYSSSSFPSSTTPSASGSVGLVTPQKVPPLEDYRTVMVQRGIFQAVASMALPAFTIHSIVRYSGRAMKNVQNQRLRTWGPIGLGLAAVPFLPYLFDKPVEEAVEWTFHRAFATFGGQDAVAQVPSTGRAEEGQRLSKVGAREDREKRVKEKEL